MRNFLKMFLTGTLLINTVTPVGALTVEGPHSTTDGGYTVVLGNTAPFDFEVQDYPIFPLQSATDPNPGQPSAWFDVTVDYGDGSPVFTESYPAIDPILPFHIKDRSFSSNSHPALDDQSGFIFNELPYYKQYPQGHAYANPGQYTLSIHAEVRADLPGLDVSTHNPLQIDVPVKVLSPEETPELSLEAKYNIQSDELTFQVVYLGLEDIQLSVNNPSTTVQNEIFDQLELTVSGIGSNSPFAQIPFSEWTVVSSEPTGDPARPWLTTYEVQIQNAAQTWNYNPASSTFWARITYSKDGKSGLIGNWYIPDGDHENNIVYFPQEAILAVDQSDLPYVSHDQASYTVITGNTALFDYVVENYPVFPANLASNVWFDVTVDYGDGSPVFTESYPAIDPILPFHIKDRSFSSNSHPALDDQSGFIFNEFPYYKQYPQGHAYANPGQYTLSIHAEVRSDITNLDLSQYAPIEIQAPVKVIDPSEAPEVSLGITEYDPLRDELSVEVFYEGPQEILLSVNNDEAMEQEILDQFQLTIRESTGAEIDMEREFSDWTLLSSAQINITGPRQYRNHYKITFSNARSEMGRDPATAAFRVQLSNGKDGSFGLMGNWLILDENLSNNSQTLTQGAPRPMALELGPDVTVRAGRPLRQSGVLRDIHPNASTVRFQAEWGDGTPANNGTFVPTSATRTFNFTHTYATRGNYTLSVCADDGFRERCDEMNVRVL